MLGLRSIFLGGRRLITTAAVLLTVCLCRRRRCRRRDERHHAHIAQLRVAIEAEADKGQILAAERRIAHLRWLTFMHDAPNANVINVKV